MAVVKKPIRNTKITLAGTTPQNLLVDFKYPLSQALKNTSLNPDIIDSRTKERVWFSNVRGSADKRWEILTISMSVPVMINTIQFGVLAKNCNYQVWYTGIDKSRTQVITEEQQPLQGTVYDNLQSAPDAWYKSDKVAWQRVDANINPIIVTSVEIRVQRIAGANTTALYSLGLRDILFQRTVRTLEDTLYPIQTSTDSLGNLVRKEILDWRPENAIDSDSYTFWKSAPQPSPNAVVNFYATVGIDPFSPNRIDRIWLDPLYTGCTMNLYYSNDSNMGKIIPRPSLIPSSSLKAIIGIDSSGINMSSSTDTFVIPTNTFFSAAGGSTSAPLGMFGDTGWIGTEIEISQGLSDATTNLTTGTFYLFASQDFNVQYNFATRKFVVTFGSGGTIDTFSTAALQMFTVGSRIQLVLACSMDPITAKYVLRLIVSSSNNIISDTSLVTTYQTNNLANMYRKGHYVSVAGIIGHIRAMIIKAESESTEVYQNFIASPAAFVSPPVRPDNTLLLNNPLDNAVYVGNFMDGSLGYGGVGDEIYEQKSWTPVWKDWKVERGYFYLPQPVVASHLKLEFSQLTPQPYPVYETGIKVAYKTFPVSATIASKTGVSNQTGVSSTSSSGALQRTNSVGTNVSPGVNFYRQVAPKTMVFLSSSDVDNLRNQSLYDPSIIGSEKISVYSKQGAATSDARDIAAATVLAAMSPSSASNAIFPNLNSDDLALLVSGAVPAVITDATTSGSLGTRVPGWWTLPGGQLKISDATMRDLTNSSVVTERPATGSGTNTLRTRFPTVSVHEYDIRYATQDAALAYFAGLRDFSVYRLDYTVPVDSDQYVVLAFKTYTSTSVNMTLSDVGTSSAGASGGNTLPTRPSTTPADNNPSILTTSTFSSVGTFIKCGMQTIDRGNHSNVTGQLLLPLGLNNSNSGFWDTDYVEWSDTVTPWGSNLGLVGVDANSNVYFSGQEATQVTRQPGNGTAGINTSKFSTLPGARVRSCIKIYRPFDTGNTLQLQLVDATPITGSVLGTYNVDISTGSWQTFKTPFITMGSQTRTVAIGTTSGSPNLTGVVGTFRPYDVGQAITGAGIPAGATIASIPFIGGSTTTLDTTKAVLSTNATSTNSSVNITFAKTFFQELQINLLINGTMAENLYVSDLYDEQNSIVYSLSNDNGVTWFEATSIINNLNSYLVFPQPGNQLKVKVQMYDVNDYAYGFTITPNYLL